MGDEKQQMACRRAQLRESKHNKETRQREAKLDAPHAGQSIKKKTRKHETIHKEADQTVRCGNMTDSDTETKVSRRGT